MATLTPITPTRDGTDLGLAQSAADIGGDDWSNDGSSFLHIHNAGGANCNVTLVITRTVDGQPVTNRTVLVQPTEIFLIGPFPTDTYSTTMQVQYDQVASVVVAVILP